MIWQFLNLILFYKWLTGNISLIIQFNISWISLGTCDVLSKNSSDPWLHSVKEVDSASTIMVLVIIQWEKQINKKMNI